MGRKKIREIVPERLRPEVKPDKVSAQEWEKSKCDKSPTGSHWFVPENGSDLRCRFCGKSHTEVSTGQKPRKRRGRPRKAKVKEGENAIRQIS